jgi:hypothetical protein
MGVRDASNDFLLDNDVMMHELIDASQLFLRFGAICLWNLIPEAVQARWAVPRWATVCQSDLVPA